MAPRFVKEDLWGGLDFPQMVIVTANSYISKRGTLVMGRGAARQLRDRIPGIDKEAAQAISMHRIPKQYGFVVVRDPRESKLGIGLFQTKTHFKNDADERLIGLAVSELRRYALANMDIFFRLNYPGIGNGNLLKEEVEPLLTNLPPNITICSY